MPTYNHNSIPLKTTTSTTVTTTTTALQPNIMKKSVTCNNVTYFVVKVKGKKELYEAYDGMHYGVNYVKDRTPPAPKITVVSSRHN